MWAVNQDQKPWSFSSAHTFQNPQPQEVYLDRSLEGLFTCHLRKKKKNKPTPMDILWEAHQKKSGISFSWNFSGDILGGSLKIPQASLIWTCPACDLWPLCSYPSLPQVHLPLSLPLDPASLSLSLSPSTYKMNSSQLPAAAYKKEGILASHKTGSHSESISSLAKMWTFSNQGLQKWVHTGFTMSGPIFARIALWIQELGHWSWRKLTHSLQSYNGRVK